MAKRAKIDRKGRAFLRAVEAVMTAGAARGHLGISAVYIEGEGAKVVLDGGEKTIAITPGAARKLAETWGTPFARANGLGAIADDLKEAADLATTKGAELRAKMT